MIQNEKWSFVMHFISLHSNISVAKEATVRFLQEIFWVSKTVPPLYSLTTLVHSTVTLFLSFLTCQVEWALGQRVYIISHVIAHFTSSSATWWTLFNTLRAWVTRIAYDHVTLNKHEWVISNELEGFHAKTAATDWRSRMVLDCDITRAPKGE